MSIEDMPLGTFVKVDSVSLIDTSKASALARISFQRRNDGFYTVIAGGELISCAHICDEISPELQDMVDAKNQAEKEAI